MILLFDIRKPRRGRSVALVAVAGAAAMAVLTACSYSNHKRYLNDQPSYATPAPQPQPPTYEPYAPSTYRARPVEPGGVGYDPGYGGGMVVEAMPAGQPRPIDPTVRYRPQDLNRAGADGVAARAGSAFADAERYWKDNPDPFATPVPDVTELPRASGSGSAATEPAVPYTPPTPTPTPTPAVSAKPTLEVTGMAFGHVLLNIAGTGEEVRNQDGSLKLKTGDTFVYGGRKWRIDQMPTMARPGARVEISEVKAPTPTPVPTPVPDPPGVVASEKVAQLVAQGSSAMDEGDALVRATRGESYDQTQLGSDLKRSAAAYERARELFRQAAALASAVNKAAIENRIVDANSRIYAVKKMMPVGADPGVVTDNPPTAVEPAPVEPAPVEPAPVDPRTLSLQSVLEMHAAGLSDSTIIAVINASVVAIDVKASNVIEMGRAGLSEAVIQAILSRVAAQDRNDGR
ncbi:MAG: hypothetical protein AB7K09_20340 [Planctomycetota bacterium]